MDSAQDPGPKGKPLRPAGRPAPQNRKPTPTRKPAPKVAPKPAAKRPTTPRPPAKVDVAVVEPEEELSAETAEEQVSPPESAEETSGGDDSTEDNSPENDADKNDDADESDAEENDAEDVAEDTAEETPEDDSPEATDEEPSEDSAADVEPGHPVVPRLSVSRLSFPKLTLPKFAGLRAAAVVEAPEKDQVVEEEAPEDEAVKTATEEDAPAEAEPVEAESQEAEPVEEPAADDESDSAQSEAPDVETASTDEAPAEASEAPSKAVVRAPRGSRKVAKATTESVLLVRSLTKQFDDKLAVAGVDLDVKVGSFYGIVGPNGAGKTTTLSMITGLLRPDSGTVAVHGADVWSDPVVAKRNMGVLPDRLRLFDRLTGAQVLYYAGVLRGLDAVTVRKRSADLVDAFGLQDALGRLVTDYSAGMMKKIALAAAMIHSPRLLVLDEPFESVDPVSAGNVTEILKTYVKAGGTVVLSSHSMDLVQRICDHVAVIVDGGILADGTMSAVRNGHTLEERFVELAGRQRAVEGFEWLSTFSD